MRPSRPPKPKPPLDEHIDQLEHQMDRTALLCSPSHQLYTPSKSILKPIQPHHTQYVNCGISNYTSNGNLTHNTYLKHYKVTQALTSVPPTTYPYCMITRLLMSPSPYKHTIKTQHKRNTHAKPSVKVSSISLVMITPSANG